MSYRDLRNFTEMLRCLGYPRLISMENFKSPNFELVAEILKWLVQRYDHNASLPTDVDSEQDRVIFIKSVAQFIASKAHVKLNTKRLYMADGYAVKEIIKFTLILYNAMKETNKANDDQSSGGTGDSMNYYNYTTKVEDLKAVREVSTQVTKCGANLYHLLSQEIYLREARLQALAQPLDINVIEKEIKSTISKVEGEIKKTLNKLDNVAADEANLEAKIAKRKGELERGRKRLMTLQNVRPAFMDEFERLEEELKAQYEEYLIKFRNMTHLEHQMDDYKRMEMLKLNENEDNRRKIQHRLKEEEKSVILSDPFNRLNSEGDLLIDDDDDDDDESDSDGDIPMRGMGRSRPQNPTHPGSLGTGGKGMYMDDDDDEDSMTSSDLQVEDDELSDDDDDDDDVAAMMSSHQHHRRQHQQQQQRNIMRMRAGAPRRRDEEEEEMIDDDDDF